MCFAEENAFSSNEFSGNLEPVDMSQEFFKISYMDNLCQWIVPLTLLTKRLRTKKMLICVDADVCCVATLFVKCFLEYLHVEYLEEIKKIIQQVVQQCKLLRRMFNLRSLITERMNKVFRENIEFLFDRFECQDLCAIVELEKLLDILKHSHELLSRDLSIDFFSLLLNEMQENISLVSFSSRLVSQIWSEMHSDFLPNFILCNTTQRFIRSSKTVLVQKPSIPSVKPSFYYGTQDLNSVHQSFA